MKSICKIDQFGTKVWYLNGKCHKKNGPAIVRLNGTKEWYVNDKLHRENGPAIESYDGDKHWYLHGKRHRKDGPAVECANGSKRWYYHDYWIDCKDHQEFLGKIKTTHLHKK